MQIIDNKALQYKLRNPAPILAAIPESRLLDENTVLVKWDLPQVQTLRALNYEAPSPIVGRYKWPGKYKPFEHQRTTAEFLTLNKRAFCFNEQGTGKTGSAIWAADFLMQRGLVKRALVVCPVSIMDAAWRADLFNFAMHRKVDIAHGAAAKRRKIIASDAEFVIINFDGLKVVEKEIAEGGFDLIIVDECFVAGTEVHTPEGPKPIEILKSGDMVFTSSGVAPIKTATSRVPQALVEVKLSNGKIVRCTPEHPFFTDHGWLPAHSLAGRQLIDLSDMPYLLGVVQSAYGNVEIPQKEWHQHRDELLAILRSEAVAPATSGTICGALSDTGAAGTGGCDPNRRTEVPRNATAPITHCQGERTQTSGTWGERDRDVTFGDRHSAAVARGVGVELPSSVGETAAKLSYELQARLRLAAEQSGLGGGRELSPNRTWTGEGQEKNGEARGTWVDSVSYCERESLEPVYNIEVDGTPNYFVGDGYLVHNCSAYQNSQTARWKTLSKLVTDDTWLWMMTGTPAAQGPDNAFGLAKLVNPAGVPKFFGKFRDEVMIKITPFKWAPKQNATETVHRVLQPAIRFTKDECLDLPDMVYVKRHVELTKQQQAFYDRIRKDRTMRAAGEDVTAVNAAVLMTKLLQVSCGAAYTDDSNTLQFDISSRYKVLKEVIDETPNKVLVFVPFQNTIESLTAKLVGDGITAEIISGSVKVGDRTDIFRRFQTATDPKVLVIQPQAAAHGVTLTAADTVVWWGPTSSLETYAQANARIHRSGQVNKCTIVQLEGSRVERRFYQLLDDKIDVHSKMIDLYNGTLD